MKIYNRSRNRRTSPSCSEQKFILSSNLHFSFAVRPFISGLISFAFFFFFFFHFIHTESTVLLHWPSRCVWAVHFRCNAFANMLVHYSWGSSGSSEENFQQMRKLIDTRTHTRTHIESQEKRKRNAQTCARWTWYLARAKKNNDVRKKNAWRTLNAWHCIVRNFARKSCASLCATSLIFWVIYDFTCRFRP